MPQSPAPVVDSFFADLGTCASYQEMLDTFQRHLADDVEWHTGTVLCAGIEECVAHLRRALDHGISHWDAEVLHQAASGAIVFNERIDRIYRTDGSKLLDTYVCAVFETEGDQIAKWRDYYDPTELRERMTKA